MTENIWKVVGVSAVTAVFVWVILTLTIGQVMFSPVLSGNLKTTASPQAQINANACSADGVCEVNSIWSSGTVNTNTLKSNGDMIINSNGGSISLIPENGGVAVAGDFASKGIRVLGGMLQLQGIGSGIKATYFEGNGTAYACVNSEGLLYRSQTPCV